MHLCVFACACMCMHVHTQGCSLFPSQPCACTQQVSGKHSPPSPPHQSFLVLRPNSGRVYSTRQNHTTKSLTHNHVGLPLTTCVSAPRLLLMVEAHRALRTSCREGCLRAERRRAPGCAQRPRCFYTPTHTAVRWQRGGACPSAACGCAPQPAFVRACVRVCMMRFALCECLHISMCILARLDVCTRVCMFASTCVLDCSCIYSYFACAVYCSTVCAQLPHPNLHSPTRTQHPPTQNTPHTATQMHNSGTHTHTKRTPHSCASSTLPFQASGVHAAHTQTRALHPTPVHHPCCL